MIFYDVKMFDVNINNMGNFVLDVKKLDFTCIDHE